MDCIQDSRGYKHDCTGFLVWFLSSPLPHLCIHNSLSLVSLKTLTLLKICFCSPNVPVHPPTSSIVFYCLVICSQINVWLIGILSPLTVTLKVYSSGQWVKCCIDSWSCISQLIQHFWWKNVKQIGVNVFLSYALVVQWNSISGGKLKVHVWGTFTLLYDEYILFLLHYISDPVHVLCNN